MGLNNNGPGHPLARWAVGFLGWVVGYLMTLITNYSNKLTCVKNGMCIAHDYSSKLNLTNPS